MKRIKRFVCGALASLMFVSVPIGGFAKVEAAEVVFGVTAWDILQTIMLSLGVTVSVQSSDLTSEVCQEIVDTFNLWVQQNGFDDTAQLKEDLTDLLVEGKKNVINISEKTWSALRSWAKDIVNGKTDIKAQKTSDVVMSYNMLNMCTYTETASHGKDGIVQVSGSISISNVSVGRYGAIGCKVFNGTGCMLVFSDEPFTCEFLAKRSSEWLKYPSNFSPGVSAPWNADDYIRTVKSEEYFKPGGEVYYIELGMPAITDTYINGLPVFEGANGYSLNQVVSQALNKCYGSDGKLAIKEYATDVIAEPVPFGGEAVSSGAWDIISKGRTWDGETVSGDVNIAIPEDIAGDIINVQEGTQTVSDVISIADSVAIPVDTTADKAIDYPMDITETLDYADTKADDITITDTDTVAPDYDGIKDSETSGKYYVKGLQSVFPFCIPFDVIDFLGCLSAPAQAPHFKIPIKYPTLKGMETYEVDLDLSKFNDVAKIVRVCETLLFCVGLAVATRNLYIRG